MIKRLLCFLAALTCLSAPALAENNDIMMRDSVYYTWDDGVMSPEEMEMEANDVFRLCEANMSQRNLFKCECLAGAFLKKREKLGPTAPQTEIYHDITLGKDVPPNCANTEIIAGDSYNSCMSQVAPIRSYATDNDEYCGCVANKVAKDFTQYPMLSPSYVRELTFNSLLYCNDPQNRPKKSAAKTGN